MVRHYVPCRNSKFYLQVYLDQPARTASITYYVSRIIRHDCHSVSTTLDHAVKCPSRDQSLLITICKYRGVSITTGLSRGVSITHRAISRCVGHNQVISWCLPHTPRDFALCRSQPGYLAVCPSHTARFRGVSVTTGLSRGVSVTHCAISRCVSHNRVIS